MRVLVFVVEIVHVRVRVCCGSRGRDGGVLARVWAQSDRPTVDPWSLPTHLYNVFVRHVELLAALGILGVLLYQLVHWARHHAHLWVARHCRARVVLPRPRGMHRSPTRWFGQEKCRSDAAGSLSRLYREPV